MLIRRLIINTLIRAAQDPTVQKKMGEVTGKVLNQARPKLLSASRRAGDLTRKATQKIRDI